MKLIRFDPRAIRRKSAKSFGYLAYRLVAPLLLARPTMSATEARVHLNRISPFSAGTTVASHAIGTASVDLMIVVPAYNVERHIEQCIDPILSQVTGFSFRLVVVDDGSNDDTARKLKRYAADDTVTIIRQPNRGSSAARNTALRVINGRYLMFVDGDDYLLQGAVESLMQRALSGGFDLVEGGYFRVSDAGAERRYKRRDTATEGAAVSSLSGYLWGKVYRAGLFANIQFPEGLYYQDTINRFLIFPSCSRVASLGECVYAYRFNSSGITSSSRQEPKSLDAFWILELLVKELPEHGLGHSQNSYGTLLDHVALLTSRTRSHDGKTKEAIFVLLAQLVEDYYSGCSGIVTGRFRHLEACLETRNYRRFSMLTRWAI